MITDEQIKQLMTKTFDASDIVHFRLCKHALFGVGPLVVASFMRDYDGIWPGEARRILEQAITEGKL